MFDLDDGKMIRCEETAYLVVTYTFICLARRGSWVAIKLAEAGLPTPLDDPLGISAGRGKELLIQISGPPHSTSMFSALDFSSIRLLLLIFAQCSVDFEQLFGESVHLPF